MNRRASPRFASLRVARRARAFDALRRRRKESARSFKRATVRPSLCTRQGILSYLVPKQKKTSNPWLDRLVEADLSWFLDRRVNAESASLGSWIIDALRARARQPHGNTFASLTLSTLSIRLSIKGRQTRVKKKAPLRIPWVCWGSVLIFTTAFPSRERCSHMCTVIESSHLPRPSLELPMAIWHR